jgi:RecB family exonuclease
LYERVLGFHPPVAPPSLSRIDTLAYGSLFHRIAQHFYQQHGSDFGDRKATLSEWLTRADELARAEFLEFLGEYPLFGDAVRAVELERVRRDVGTLVDYDWDGGRPRKFIDVERSFGPVPISAAGGAALFIRGRIDRVDRDGNATLIRDLKTGRAHPRIRDEEAPDPARDVQLALYGLVARALAPDWGLPRQVAAAYSYVDHLSVEKERAFRADYQRLEQAAEQWLTVSVGLLSARAFPRTPNVADCKYCNFQPVCGPHAQSRAGDVLSNASGALAAFKEMKS